MSDRNYVRIYYNDLEADYPDVWDDDEALAAFVRLLANAEAMWPARPELPRSLKDRAQEMLAKCGLLIALPRARFTMKGLDAERNARRNAGRIAASSRWGNAKPMPNQTEPSLTESPLPLTRGRRKHGTSPRQLGENPRANGTSPRQEREALKRGPTQIHEILTAIQTKGSRP